MSQPIPAEVMEEARKLLREGNCVACIDDIYCCCFEPLCEALQAAEKRGEQRERKRCAKIVEDEDGKYSWAGEDRHARLLQQHGVELASAIRSPT